MSSVTPTDNGYNYYQKKLSEDESEIQAEAKRNEENRNRIAKAQEERFNKTLQKNESELQERATQIHEQSNEAIQSSRESARRDVERNRAETYDKMGKFIESQSKDAADRKAEYDRAEETMKSQYTRASTDNDTAYAQKLQQRDIEFNDRLTQSVKEAKESATDTYGSVLKKKEDEAYSQLKTIKEGYAKMEGERLADSNYDRRTHERNLTEQARGFQISQGNDERNLYERLDKMDRANQARTADTVARQNEVHRDDTAFYRGQVKDLLSATNDYTKEKSSGRADAIREYNNDVRMRETGMSDAFRLDHQNLEKGLRDQESHYSQTGQDRLAERERYLTGMMREQSTENEKNIKETVSQFTKDREQLEKQGQHDKESASKAASAMAESQAQLRENELKNQGVSFREAIAQTRESDGQKIAVLEKKLNERATTDDISLISPAAEHAVRSSVMRQYEKEFQAEREGHQKTLDTTVQNFQAKLADSVQNKDLERTQVYNEQLSARQTDAQKFQNYIAEAQFERDNTMKNAEAERQRTGLNATRAYSNSLMKQKQEYDEVYTGQKLQSDAKMQAVREESEFNLKMAARNSAAHEQELIRNYEGKLADLKADTGAQVDDLKSQLQTQSRESERKSKTELDQQAKGYDQRIAQMEAQHKERERLITANYQDELEKARRANAFIIQKKS